MDSPDPIRTEFQSAINENPSGGVSVDEIVAATTSLRIITEKSQKLPGKYVFKVFTDRTGSKPSVEFDGQPAPERFDVPSIPAYLPGKNKDDLLAGTEIIKFAAKGWLIALFRGVFYLGGAYLRGVHGILSDGNPADAHPAARTGPDPGAPGRCWSNSPRSR